MLLTADTLFHYQRCHRRSFLDVYGDPHRKIAASDFLHKLQDDSAAYRLAVLSQMSYQKPQYPYGDLAAGAQATLELMKQGIETIYQGILLASGPHNFTLTSSPDLLIKQPGESALGDWLYMPVDIKLSKRPKQDYQIIMAFHAHLLAAMQGVLPSQAWLWLRGQRSYGVNLSQRLPQMQQLVKACSEMLHYQQEPEVFISRHPCSLCQWYSSCYQLATTTQHLSLLPGVTPIRYTQLQNLNITTLEALATADPVMLNELPEFAEKGEQVVLQAQAVYQNQPLISPSASGLPADLPTSVVELYFDIEAQPEMDLAFLHGVLVVNRLHHTETFYPFLAESPLEAETIWQEFLNLVCAYPNAPVFHFCDYEVQVVKQLAKRFHTPASVWKPLLKRFVDVHERVTRLAVLPVENYALKTIARWLGFEWRNPQANGAQCVYWYDQWLATGNRALLESIQLYNEDDCRATRVVKDWLAGFLQEVDQQRSCS
jgi:predicted RecB family nuclease